MSIWSPAHIAVENTDRELWIEGDDGPSIHVTEGGGIGINVGGIVYVRTLRQWHALASAKEPAPAPKATP